MAKRRISTWSNPKPNSLVKLTEQDRQDIIKAQYDYIDRTNKDRDSIFLLIIGASVGIVSSSLTTLFIEYFGVSIQSIIVVSLLFVLFIIFLVFKIKDLNEGVDNAERYIEMWKKVKHVEFGPKLKVERKNTN